MEKNVFNSKHWFKKKWIWKVGQVHILQNLQHLLKHGIFPVTLNFLAGLRAWKTWTREGLSLRLQAAGSSTHYVNSACPLLSKWVKLTSPSPRWMSAFLHTPHLRSALPYVGFPPPKKEQLITNCGSWKSCTQVPRREKVHRKQSKFQ